MCVGKGSWQGLRTQRLLDMLSATADTCRMISMRRRASIFWILGLGCSAQNQTPTFRSDTDLVTVSFQVESGRENKLVTDLRPDEIQILADGRPQTVALLEGARSRRRVPVEVVLLFDCSRSTWDTGVMNTFRFDPSILRERENVRIALYAFSHEVRRLVKPTADIDVLNSALRQIVRIQPDGSPIYESIRTTAEDMASQKGEAIRTMVIFSDGEEPSSKDNIAQTVQVAAERNIRLYPVLLHNPLEDQGRRAGQSGYGTNAGRNTAVVGRPNTARDQQHAMFLSLAQGTGGADYMRQSPGNDVINDVLRKVALQLESTWVAGYYPEASSEKREHSVQVRLLSGDRRKLLGGTRTVVY